MSVVNKFNVNNTLVALDVDIFDVSAHNNGAVFESLSDLLNNDNLDTLIPLTVRKGGMTIKFIQGSVSNSNNKYVQYRLMLNTWSAIESYWKEDYDLLNIDFADWQYQGKYIANNNLNVSTIIDFDNLPSNSKYSVFKVFCPKNKTCYMKNLYVTETFNEQYVYILDENNRITKRIAKGETCNYFDVEYTATEDCWITASSFYNTIKYIGILLNYKVNLADANLSERITKLKQTFIYNYSNWQYVGCIGRSDTGERAIGDIINFDSLHKKDIFKTFKVFCPKGAFCEMKSMYVPTNLHEKYIYILDAHGNIINRISKGEETGTYDINYTATEDCWIAASSILGSVTVKNFYGAIANEANFTLSGVYKHIKTVDNNSNSEVFVGAIITSTFSVGDFINPYTVISSYEQFRTFIVQFGEQSKISLSGFKTASTTMNICITDLNFKIKRLVNVQNLMIQNNLDIYSDEAGYVILVDNLGSHSEESAKVVIKSIIDNNNPGSRYELFEGSAEKLTNGYIHNSYALSLGIGDTLDESNFIVQTNDNFAIAKIPVNKGDKISLLQWQVNSSDDYYIFTDFAKKVVQVTQYTTYGSNFNDIFESPCDGYFYISQNLQVEKNREYGTIVFNRNNCLENYHATLKDVYDKLVIPNEVQEKVSKLYDIETLDESVFARIKSGDTLKIGFLGDSTTDGIGTTSFNRPVNGHEGSNWDNIYNGGPGTIGTTDYRNPQTYSYKLERLLVRETNNNNFKVYNLGWSGKSYEWAWNNRADIFGHVYSDIDYVGLVYGINDSSQYSTVLKNTISRYTNALLNLIDYIHSLGKGVFIVNPQAVFKGDWDGNEVSNQETLMIFRHINKQICNKFNLRLLNLTDFDLNLQNSTMSNKEYQNDALHYKSLGHTLEAGYLFSEIVRRTAKCSEQDIVSYLQYNWQDDADVILTQSSTSGEIYEGFKVYFDSNHTVNGVVDNSEDVVLMDVYIINDSDSDKEIFGYTKTLGSQHCIVTNIKETTATAETGGEPVDIFESIDVTFANNIQKLADLKVGELKHFVIKSGNNKRSFAGIKMV